MSSRTRLGTQTPASLFGPDHHIGTGAPVHMSPDTWRLQPDTLHEAFCRQTAIATLARAVLGGSDLDKILADACRYTANAAEVAYCKIIQHRGDAGDFLVRAGFGWSAETWQGGTTAGDTTHPGGHAFQSRRPVVLNDARRDLGYVLCSLDRAHQVIAVASVPIVLPTGRPFGALELSSPELCGFGPAEIGLLEAVAEIVARAITNAEQKQADQAAAELCQTTLREMQHRFRNDLQMVQMLASREAHRTSDAASARGFEAIGRRVLALSALYEHLLGSEFGSAVDLADYLGSLCAKIEATGELGDRNIALNADLDSQLVELGAAVAFGTVLTELVANAAEHAFPARQGGHISVRLRANEENFAVITVADDGRGCADGFKFGRGLELARRLVGYAGGELRRQSGPGTTWQLKFNAS